MGINTILNRAIKPLACAGFMLLAVNATAATMFTAHLDGAQANAGAGVDTDAFRDARLRLSNDGTALEMAISIFGLDFNGSTADPNDDVTRMHLHAGAAGVNGGIVFGLIAPDHDLDGDLQTLFHAFGGTLVSTWDGAEGNGTTLADQLSTLLANGLYINVHTVGNPGGEIRGQIIVASPVPVPAAVLLFAPVLGWLATRHRHA